MRDSNSVGSGGVVDNWTQKPLFLARTLGDMEWVVHGAHIEKLNGVAVTELPCSDPGRADWPDGMHKA